MTVNGFSSSVYKWADFSSFVMQKTNWGADDRCPAILDCVARDLLLGRLVRYDLHGIPADPPKTAGAVSRSFLDPIAVNRLPVMKQWRLRWLPGATSGHALLTPAQRREQFGWKATLHQEAVRYWLGLKAVGGTPTLVGAASELHRFATRYGIKTDHGRIPSAIYIRTHVISRKHWQVPS